MTTLKTLITTMIIAFSIPCNAYANDPAIAERITALRKKAYAAASSDDFKYAAIIYTEILGIYDDPIAANNLAGQYLRGNGVTADAVIAVELFKKAIAFGFEDVFSKSPSRGAAATSLGWIYLTGEYEGVARNPGEALRWTLRGARLGHTNAYSNLALMYATGFGVKRDYKASITQLIKSIDAYSDAFNWILNSEDEWLRFGKDIPKFMHDARGIYWQAIRSGDKESSIRRLQDLQAKLPLQ